MSNRLLLILLLVSFRHAFAQVEVRGLSFWKSPTLNVYHTTNYLSNERTPLFEVTPDSIGIFQFEWNTSSIEQLQICSNDRCSWFYVQPNGHYIIELPDDTGIPSLAEQKEVELLFYKLDTLDINYRILGFEAWMDQYISEIYQLKDIRSNEFISKIRAFKSETAAIYHQDGSKFLKDYIKYSIGLTIDNFSVIGSPSKEDKYSFYLSTDSVDFKQPKLIEFSETFYQNYFDQLEQENHITAQNALKNSNCNQYVEAFKSDPYIFNEKWAEYVAFLSIDELLKSQLITDAFALDMYNYFGKSAQQIALRDAAKFRWKQLNQLKIGKKVAFEFLNSELGIELPNKIICLHFFQPGNQKCISEIAALQKVAERHQQYLQIISIYPDQFNWTKADLKAYEKVKWPKVALPPTSKLWTMLSWQSAPAYLLIDREQVVRFMPALGPIPNGIGQTIDTQIIQLK